MTDDKLLFRRFSPPIVQSTVNQASDTSVSSLPPVIDNLQTLSNFTTPPLPPPLMPAPILKEEVKQSETEAQKVPVSFIPFTPPASLSQPTVVSIPTVTVENSSQKQEVEHVVVEKIPINPEVAQEPQVQKVDAKPLTTQEEKIVVATTAIPQETIPDAKKITTSPPQNSPLENARVMPITPLLLFLSFLTALFLASGGMFYYMHSQSERNVLGTNVQSDSQKLIDEVGNLVELPVGEVPTTGTVSDIAKLQAQPLFAHAQNGDRILFYPKAGIAFIYRPSDNKIVGIGPFNTTSSPTQSVAQPAPQEESVNTALPMISSPTPFVTVIPATPAASVTPVNQE